MVRVVISSWRIRNIRSSSSSGLVSWESITCCSSPGSFSATWLIRPRWRRATAEVMAKDSSCGVAGRNRPRLEPAERRVGLDERLGRVDDRVQRSVHRDEVVAPDDLVELEQVHVPGVAEQGRLGRDEHVVGVRVDGRHVVARAARLQHHLVAAEVAQVGLGLVAPLGDVHPDETRPGAAAVLDLADPHPAVVEVTDVHPAIMILSGRPVEGRRELSRGTRPWVRRTGWPPRPGP